MFQPVLRQQRLVSGSFAGNHYICTVSRRKWEEGAAPLFYCRMARKSVMVSVEQVRNSVEKHIQGTTHFVVAVEVRPGSKVVVEVDNDRAITLQELADLNKAVRDDLGEAADDCEFQFSSPGMGRPFKVSRQYQKHTGRLVQVDLVDGRTLEGKLEHYDGSIMGLRIQHPSKVKGRLPKLDDEVTTIPAAEIRTTKASITFN